MSGSLWRNWHIISLLLAVAVSFLGFGVVAPLRTLYARAEGASGGEVGLMAAAYLFAAFVFLFPFGWLSDRTSRVGIIVCGLAAHGLISLAYIGASSGEAFIVLRFLEGAASAAVMPAARALLADLVPEGRNGEAFGLMSAGMIFGITGGPPIGTFIAEGIGYTAAYLIAAALFVPAIVLMLFAFRGYSPARRVSAAATPDARGHWRDLWTVPIVAGCLVRLAVGLGPGLAISIWSIYMADLGFSLTLIGWTYTVYAIPILLVAPSAGRLSDRYGRLLPMFAGGLLLSLVWIGYGVTTTFLVFLLLGVAEGSLDAIARSANDGYLADHSPAGSRGRAQGLFSAATQLGNLVGAVAAGYIYEANRSLPFTVVGIAEAVLIGGALALTLFARATAPQPAPVWGKGK